MATSRIQKPRSKTGFLNARLPVSRILSFEIVIYLALGLLPGSSGYYVYRRLGSAYDGPLLAADGVYHLMMSPSRELRFTEHFSP